MKRFLFILCTYFLTGYLFPQEIQPEREGTTTLFGYVHDNYDGFQVQGAWVWVDGTNLAASTDSWGHYEISGVPVVPLSADFSGDVTNGPFPLVVQFHGFTEGGSPVVKITHPAYLDWRADQVSLVTNGFTNVSADLHPRCSMRISAEWDYYQYLNPVDAYLKTPSIGGQTYQINSISPEGSLGAPPYALFLRRDLGSSAKLIYLTFSELHSGTYRYYLFVDKFGIGWGYDVPTIRIFNQDSLVFVCTSLNTTGGNYWHICDIAGPGGEITLVDQWLYDPPPVAGSAGTPREYQAFRVNSPQVTAQRTFSWDFGDGGTSTEQDPMHTYTVAGTYTVSLSVSDGVSEVIKTKENYIGVGVSDVMENKSIVLSLKPNPASNQIVVEWSPAGEGFSGGVDWKIFDCRGRIVLQGKRAANPSRDLRIDISGLPRGVYIIRINGDNIVSGCSRFIAE